MADSANVNISKKWAANVSWMVCIRLSFRFALPDRRLLQMTRLLNLCPSVLTDRTFIKLGSKCYYRWDLYYTWVQLLHLSPLHSNPWKLHFLFLLHLTGCQTWIRRLQLKRPWSRAGGFYFSWGLHTHQTNHPAAATQASGSPHTADSPFQALRARRDQQRNNNIILFA